MNRPTYQTAEDLEREIEVIQYVCDTYGKKYRQLSKKNYYRVDFALLVDNRIESLVEVKCRTKPYNFFKYYTISLQKVVNLKALSLHSNIKCGLIIHFSCGKIVACNANDIPMNNIYIGGRYDRNDPQDIEPMVKMDMDVFVTLKESDQ